MTPHPDLASLNLAPENMMVIRLWEVAYPPQPRKQEIAPLVLVDSRSEGAFESSFGDVVGRVVALHCPMALVSSGLLRGGIENREEGSSPRSDVGEASSLDVLP